MTIPEQLAHLEENDRAHASKWRSAATPEEVAALIAEVRLLRAALESDNLGFHEENCVGETHALDIHEPLLRPDRKLGQP